MSTCAVSMLCSNSMEFKCCRRGGEESTGPGTGSACARDSEGWEDARLNSHEFFIPFSALERKSSLRHGFSRLLPIASLI